LYRVELDYLFQTYFYSLLGFMPHEQQLDKTPKNNYLKLDFSPKENYLDTLLLSKNLSKPPYVTLALSAQNYRNQK